MPPATLIQVVRLVGIEQRSGARRPAGQRRRRARRVAGVERRRQSCHLIAIAEVLLKFDHLVRFNGQTVFDVLSAAVCVRDLLVLIGHYEKVLEAEADKAGIELPRHVLALVDDQKGSIRTCRGRGQRVDDFCNAIPVDLSELIGFRCSLCNVGSSGANPRNGSARDLPKCVQKPPHPRLAVEAVTEELAARPIEEVIEHQEQIVVLLPVVASGANQRKHRLAGPRPADDQVLAFLGQGARRFLFLAEVLDARQLKLALGHQPGACTQSRKAGNPAAPPLMKARSRRTLPCWQLVSGSSVQAWQAARFNRSGP